MDNIDISIRELVKMMNLEEVPIYFHDKDKLEKENYMFFQYVGNEEKEALQNGTHVEDKEYSNYGIGVHVPDVTIREYYDLEMKRNPYSVNSLIQDISCIFTVWIKEYALVLAVFSILHEVGHWFDFKNSGKTGYQFVMNEQEGRKILAKEAKAIYQMNDFNPQKRCLAIEYNKKYRDNPLEKRADEYALKNIQLILEMIREKMGYTEKDLLNHSGF